MSPGFGGTWVTSDASVATVNAFTGELTAVSAGTVICSHTDAATGCTGTTELITVNEKPEVEFTAPDIICVGFTTNVSPNTGGVVNPTQIISGAEVDNLGNVAGISPGMTELVFTNTTTTGCTSDTLKVTVLASTPVFITGPSEICIGETTTLSPTTGGTWSSNNPSVATVTNAGIVTGVDAGAATFTFTSGSSICVSSDIDPIIVNGYNSIVLEDNVLCVGESTVAATTAIGTWTTSNPAVATIDANTGVITAIAEGSVTITFVNTTTGCGSLPSETLIIEKCNLHASSCEDIDPDNIICDYDLLDNFEGALTTEISSGTQPSGELCDGGEEAGNIQWLGFVAGEGDYEIEVNTINCISSIPGVTGVQVGLYSDCDFDASNLIFCEVNLQDESTIRISSDLLVPEKVYYLFINGMGNAPCEFAIQIDGVYDDAFCNDLSKVTGTAFMDVNENGIFDTNETPLRNALISLFPGNFSVLTNDEGKYTIETPKGGATLTAKMNEGDWEDDFLMIEDVTVFEACVEDIDFGFVPSANSSVSATLSVSNTIVRCDWETRFFITVENTGMLPFDGLLEFTFDDKATFFSSPIPNLNVNGNIVSAETGTLMPFSPQEFQVTLKMPSGSANLPILEFKAELKQVDETPVTEYSYGEQLRCSYDPNDKREFPDRPGAENLTLMDEDIEYTIRFQNNGNDTAFTVKIVDELDPNIEPRSIRVVNSSHDVETCIEDNLLIFLFEDINLVDSMTNYEGSQGFVTFRSSTKDGVAESTPVYNSADIIFDTNEPIITNNTLNTLVSKLCSNVETEIDMEICFGDTYNGYDETGVYTETFTTEFGCDSVVVLDLEVHEVTYTSQDIQLCEGDSIVINDMLYSFYESEIVMDTVLNSIGCVSNVITYNFKVIPTLFMQVDTTICEGMDYNGLEESGVYTLESFDPITGCDVFTTVDLEVLPLSDPACAVGIEEEIENEVKIYPNPAQDIVTIESLSDIESVAIYTIDYSKIKEKLFINGRVKVQLEVEDLNHGLYFIAIKSEGKILYKKLIIK